jgi:hypothetical protein
MDVRLNELKRSQAELLKDLKRIKRKAQFTEYVAIIMVVGASFAVMYGNITVSTAVGLVSIGLLFSIIGARYFIEAAILPASEIALDGVDREMDRLHALDALPFDPTAHR